MTTEVKYLLRCNTGPDSGYQVGPMFDSEMGAKHYAMGRKEEAAQDYTIIAVITTHSKVDTFTVPAYVPTLEEIAQDIISWSSGSFYIEWGDDFEKLNDEDRRKVEDMVNSEIESCEWCGWHWHKDDTEYVTGELLCYKCAEDAREEEGEEDED